MPAMSLLTATARRRSGGTLNPRTIDAAMPLTLDWDNAVTIVSADDMPGETFNLREQDDVIYDPAGPVDYVFYFSNAATSNIQGSSSTWRTTSNDGVAWSQPEQCTVSGEPMAGQDPSLVQTFIAGEAPTLHRDADGRIWLYQENNSTARIDAYHSTDGVAWTLAQASVISTGSGWEGSLVGSPVARYDGTQYIVGYEGIGGGTESHGIAYGTTPTFLGKHPDNPVITAASLGASGASAFNDAMWFSADGQRICSTGHAGIAGDVTMYRVYTTNLDPQTWADSDFTLLGMVATFRNDLTAFTHQDRLVTQPANDLSFVTVPLVLP